MYKLRYRKYKTLYTLAVLSWSLPTTLPVHKLCRSIVPLALSKASVLVKVIVGVCVYILNFFNFSLYTFSGSEKKKREVVRYRNVMDFQCCILIEHVVSMLRTNHTSCLSYTSVYTFLQNVVGASKVQ